MPRRISLLLLLFLWMSAEADSEIRVAEIAAAEIEAVTGEAAESDWRQPARLTARIHDYSSKLVKLYQEYLDGGGTAKGNLVLEFTIREDGYLRDVRVVSDTLGDAALAEKIAGRVGGWFFLRNDDPEHPGEITCRYSFCFGYRFYYSPLDVIPLASGVELHPGRRPYWVELEITPRLGELLEIYNVYLLGNPSLEGEITFGLIIRADGTQDGLELLGNTTGSDGFAADVLRKISLWRFTALEDASALHDVYISYPLRFGSRN